MHWYLQFSISIHSWDIRLNAAPVLCRHADQWSVSGHPAVIRQYCLLLVLHFLSGQHNVYVIINAPHCHVRYSDRNGYTVISYPRTFLCTKSHNRVITLSVCLYVCLYVCLSVFMYVCVDAWRWHGMRQSVTSRYDKWCHMTPPWRGSSMRCLATVIIIIISSRITSLWLGPAICVVCVGFTGPPSTVSVVYTNHILDRLIHANWHGLKPFRHNPADSEW